MPADVQDTLRRAIARLAALEVSASMYYGGSIDSHYVDEFHAVLDSFEGIGVDVAQFRVPSSQVRPQSRRENVYFGGATLSDESYTDKLLLLARLRASLAYLKELPTVASGNDPIPILDRILSRFHLVARRMQRRHDSRKTLDIVDEYDVQDLLHALLTLFFDDIRTEEWTPSYAGGSNRMDFLLKNEQTVIEAKRTSNHLRDKQVGEQLIVDIARYKDHPDCKALVCFIYDPEGKLGNPAGLENDLVRLSTDSLKVSVHIFPK